MWKLTLLGSTAWAAPGCCGSESLPRTSATNSQAKSLEPFCTCGPGWRGKEGGQGEGGVRLVWGPPWPTTWPSGLPMATSARILGVLWVGEGWRTSSAFPFFKESEFHLVQFSQTVTTQRDPGDVGCKSRAQWGPQHVSLKCYRQPDTMVHPTPLDKGKSVQGIYACEKNQTKTRILAKMATWKW